MTTSSINKLITAFVLLVIGIVLLGSVATSTTLITSKSLINNESHNLDNCVAITAGGGWAIDESDSYCNVTVTNAPTSWRTYDCGIASVVVDNGTGTPLTASTDYNLFSSTGIIKMETTTATENLTGNNTYVDYSYCGDGYMNLAWGRSIQNLVPGFFALAILGISLMLFYSIGKEEGILG